MNLIIDIGNTRVKMGVFEKGSILKKLIWGKLEEKRLKVLLAKYNIKKVAVSSTAGLSPLIERFLKKNYQLLYLNAKTSLPIKNLYKTPKTLGKDRLAGAVGANHIFPTKNCLVIDAGTCITYDMITREGDYLGGNISPGVKMRFKAMHEFTAKLPEVKQRNYKTLIGKTTISALQTGGALGAVLEMEGFIKAYRKEFTPLRVILTGGDADFFANQLKTKIFVNQNLVLIGLNKILSHNAV